MWDYIIIILAVVCFAGQFAFTKVYEESVKQTAVTSLVMLFLTGLLGAALYLVIGKFRVDVSLPSVLFALAFAVVMIPYYMISIKVLSLGSLAVYSMFMMLGGMLLPFLYGILFLQEGISWGKALGCVLLTGFIVLQALSQKTADSTGAGTSQTQEKGNPYLFFLLCLCIFVINGLTGVIAKAHQIQPQAVGEVSFTVLSCAFTALISGVLLLIVSLSKRKESLAEMQTVFQGKPLAFIGLLGAAMHTGNFLILKAAANVPASVQFPLISGGTIVLSALASALIFKEKLSWKEWISVGGAFATTFLFAF